ncbi:MOSC domain-containing protein [Nocardioides sp. Soil805]|uniref:MOSC domain-containing protein n=1 Tax=Nocardioides sp. Soil805 TaxID=1736416 RepID=UPI000703B99E|nr:MOSC domain-containing protein [Nocardioides sp. Soil805]KRF34178.1 hypothetical protein ASG94_15745 [Nocardioides sp. Soil805]
MHVARIGFTPLKGGRHRAHEAVRLTRRGPVGDRMFCLVDPDRDRCLRTVESPTLLQTSVAWDGTVLTAELPAVTVSAAPVPTPEVREVDYWGRTAALRVMDGPWAAAYSTHLGREVVLARAAPGEVVYGAVVTLVTRSSLARLAEEVGARVDGARFRSTFELDGDDLAPMVERDWVGRRLRIGDAELRIRGIVPRCAVVDLDPATGVRDLPLVKALASLRQPGGGVVFGVDADVVVPGQVTTGDPAELSDR